MPSTAKAVDETSDAAHKARVAMLIQAERALDAYQIDSDAAMNYLGRAWRPPWWWGALLASAGVAILVASLWVIVGDFPRAWEGPTLIYFSKEDGFTVSDLVASVGCVAGELFVLLVWDQISKAVRPYRS